MRSGNPALFFGTSSGQAALDQDEFGGNPFATSLIELSSKPAMSLKSLPQKLRSLTAHRTQNRQIPECAVQPPNIAWEFFLPRGSRQERRVALVLIVSSYSHTARPRLEGAAVDERRIASMLASHGFSVMQGIGPNREALLSALNMFARASKGHDVALIYSTGHGVEADRQVFLLPEDYRFNEGFSRVALAQHSVPVSRIVAAARGQKLNLVFFAGCRTLVGSANGRTYPANLNPVKER